MSRPAAPKKRMFHGVELVTDCRVPSNGRFAKVGDYNGPRTCTVVEPCDAHNRANEHYDARCEHGNWLPSGDWECLVCDAGRPAPRGPLPRPIQGEHGPEMLIPIQVMPISGTLESKAGWWCNSCHTFYVEIEENGKGILCQWCMGMPVPARQNVVTR